MDPSPGERVAAVALVADLMFASRVRGAASAAGVEAVTVSSADRLLEEVRRRRPRVVLVDLETRNVDAAGVVARLKADPATAGTPVIAFGSHVNGEVLVAARGAGADRVLARSAFVRELPSILRGPPGPGSASG